MSVNSQDLQTQAEENPLSTVFYLLSTTEKDSKVEQKACLAKSLAKAARFTEIEDAARMAENGSYVDVEFVAVANELITNGKRKKASQFVSFLVNRFGDDSYRLQMVLKPLIRLGRDEEALQIIAKFDDSDKVDGSFALAKIYLENRQPQKALSVISNITNLVDKSIYGEDKADLGLYYAKLGKEAEALRFSRESMKDVTWTSGKPEYTEGRIIDRVVETYKILGKDKDVSELLSKQGVSEDPVSVIERAEHYLSQGNRQKVGELLGELQKTLNPSEYWDSIDLGRLVDIYLKLGDVEKAERLVKGLTGSNYVLRQGLLNIADFYIKRKNKTKTLEILDFALEQAKKIDISEPESGLLSTSGKWDKAQYQSQIAVRLIDMRFDNQALRLISQIQKPYLRTLALTEFVAVNKKRFSSSKLRPYLEEALLLLRRKKTDVFDSKKFDVYAITARNFAEIRMNEKANEVFTEALSSLDKEMIEDGSDNSLLFAMCNIGVEFERSKIKSDEQLKTSLRNIISHWQNEDY